MGVYADSFAKFRLLMWKNWRLQLRHPIQTLFEILVPVFFCVILSLVRSLAESEVIPEQHFQSFTATDSSYIKIENYTIYYSPKCAMLEEGWRDAFMQIAPHIGPLDGYKDAAQLEQVLIATDKANKVGIEFPDHYATLKELPKKIAYTMRYPSELYDPYYTPETSVPTWRTNLLFPLFQEPGPRQSWANGTTADPNYHEQNFLKLQTYISKALIKAVKPSNAEFLPHVEMQRYSYPSYIRDFLINAMKDMINLIIVLAFVFTTISIIKVITTEKEKQLKESMKIMGLPGWLHWTAWFVQSFMFMFISVTIMAALFKIDAWYDTNTPAILPTSDFFLVWIFLTLFAIATITLCFMISVFFNKANMAAGIGGVLFFLCLLPHTLLNQSYQELALSTKMGASLLSNAAMAYGFQLICMFEMTGEGLQWDNLFRPVTPDDNLTMAHIFLMLIIDSVIYMCIALYVEAIYPGQYGVAKRWDFVVSWMWRRKADGNTPGEDDITDHAKMDPANFEKDPSNITAGIDIRGLSKVYGSDKIAVNNMRLRMYEDQITVLLGHNGAGKTTTMSMLTGLENPSTGTAVINGHDITTNMNEVRDSLGLCPQHNILFDELTVSEHIRFYSRLKGMTDEKSIRQEIDDYVKLLNLEAKRDQQAKTLSGGMKRKLSVAVAFCGGSKVVMLDEPTAGMDPAARRALWELVESQKQGRTIMLTTHFMDEADLLGDRIAIMAGGVLQCCGSSFFLKKRYGAGYHLVIDKLPLCDVERITRMLRSHIPDVRVESDVGSELTYLLNEEDSVHFQKMLSNVEENMDGLRIGSYGISLTTLEEVFMKVGADNSLHTLPKEYAAPNGHTVDMAQTPLLTGFDLLLNQTQALFTKRILSTLRSWPLLLTQLLIPIVLLVLAVIAGRQSSTKELPALPIHLASYKDPVTVLKDSNPSSKYISIASHWLKDQGSSIQQPDNVTEFIMDLTTREPATFRLSYLIGMEVIYDGIGANGTTIKAWFNNEPYHTPPLVLNFIYNVLLKSVDANYEISLTHAPLPLTVDSKLKLLQQGNNMGFQLAINIGFCMTFISAFYIMFYVRERVCKAKHLQFVSGVNIFLFWAVAFVWDWCTYIVTVTALLVTLLCFQEDGFKSGEDMGNLILMFFYFGAGVMPIIYVMSFLYELPATGFTRIILFSTVLGTFGFMIVEILYFDALDLLKYAKVLDWILLFVPHYALTNGIRNYNVEFNRVQACIATENAFLTTCIEKLTEQFPQLPPEVVEEKCLELLANVTNEYCPDATPHYYDWERPGFLRNIVLSIVVGVVFTVVLLLIEFKIFQLIWYAMQPNRSLPSDPHMDHDVKNEIQKVEDMDESQLRNYELVVRNMGKYYGKNAAVKGLCLAVGKYECFGLLGVNGAGKTTSFRMITGDTDITSGDVFVHGINLKYDIGAVYSMIGYCPQFDALFDDLTGRETITMFALLRGFPRTECDAIAERLARDFDFLQHLDKQVRQMSGGNKRKLSTSVALIGDPPIIYLDEPTTGMDPATKRHLWNALCRLRDRGKCLILTTHSMEECEALCTRLAIMVDGRFKCLGSTQHLKNKFARGFSLTVKIKKEAADGTMQRVITFVIGQFPSAEQREQHQEMVTFYIPDAGLPWSQMFGIMEASKEHLEIEDYSLGQSSLEQVFLKFTQEVSTAAYPV